MFVLTKLKETIRPWEIFIAALLMVMIVTLCSAALAQAAPTYIVTSGGGGCNGSATSIPGGTWDTPTSTCTLTQDIAITSGDGIAFLANNSRLDGQGHLISGSGTGTGVILDSVVGVTVQSVRVTGFNNGIVLNNANHNWIVGSVAAHNNAAIALTHSSYNELQGNAGIYGVTLGIDMWNSSDSNTLIGNTAANNGAAPGFYMGSSDLNSLFCNSSINNGNGVALSNSSAQPGHYSSSNTINNNNFVGNVTKAVDYGGPSAHNSYSSNFWDTAPYTTPLIFSGGADNSPLPSKITCNCGKPQLTISNESYWATYPDYVAHIISVDITVTNVGTLDANDIKLTWVEPQSILLTDLPLSPFPANLPPTQSGLLTFKLTSGGIIELFGTAENGGITYAYPM